MAVVVLHLLGTLDRGGAETVALGLCRAVPATEYHQVFLTLGGRDGRLAGQFRQAGATVEQLPLRPALTFSWRLWRYLRTHRPPVIVSHVSLVSGLVLSVAAVAGVPRRIAHMHSDGDGRPDTVSRRLHRAGLRTLLWFGATAVVGVTAEAIAFAGAPKGDLRYRVLLNGMDLARFATARRRTAEPGRAPVLVHIGRAAPEKNRAFLLRVHAEAHRREPGTTLKFVGPGGTADLDAAGVAYADDPHIEVLGETDQVEQVLTECDVLLLPSLREGMPGVALQALASGLPVLGANLAGLREIAAHSPGITVLPLEAGPREWARVALHLAGLPQSTRDEISDGMLRSPFVINRYAASWIALWTE